MPVSRILVHNAEGGFEEAPDVESISNLLRDPRHVVWLDIQDPTQDDIELLKREFDFHDLALEDVITRGERPKIERYDDWYFIVFYAVRPGLTDEINLFVGEGFLVTVHLGEVPEIAETAARWRRNADRMGGGVAVPVYSLLDAIVDGYFPLTDDIAEQVEALEDQLFQPHVVNRQAEVFKLKRTLLELRRVVAPEREVLNVLIRRDDPILGEQTIVYFQDIYDHLIRVLDTVDLYRDHLSGLLEVNLAVVSNRLNDVVKRMTALSTILMSVNLVASNYGMNFETMPELRQEYGYLFALGLMVLVGVVLTLVFKRIGWL